MHTEVLGLIPARGGSKDIPRKNIRPFANYPLIAYSIAAGLASKTVNRVIVSTDDEEIAEIARSYGAEVPFKRPAKYAQDNSTDLPVFQHALKWLSKNENYYPQIVVQLRPTSPLRKVEHIDKAVNLLLKNPQADSVRTVCTPSQNPFKMWTIDDDGFMKPLLQTKFNEPYNLPRQTLPDTYWQTGYVDVAWTNTILKKKSMTGKIILPLVTDPENHVDIDSISDWRRAENLLSDKKNVLNYLGFQIKRRKNARN